MADIRARLSEFFKALPLAHRVVLVATVAAFLMATVVFLKWVTSPSYTVLFSGLEQAKVADVVTELESAGVPYKLEGGGTTILIPREKLYGTRATLASTGLSGTTLPEGYEHLDRSQLSVSDDRQAMDFKRALEGEISKTLMAMGGINSAKVNLAVPKKELFAKDQEPVTASVVVDTDRPLDQNEIETITFLVASSVEGLDVSNLTVADSRGQTLHAPGDAGGASVQTNRNLRQTREFEQALADDIKELLGGVAGTASVVVRADLDFDQREQTSKRYDKDSAVVRAESIDAEEFEGVGAAQAGAVGVDGGPVPTVPGSETNYNKEGEVREWLVDEVQERIVGAAGDVEQLSVAIVMDDGSITGAPVPPIAEVEALVAAAVGLDQERGDQLAVSTVPFPDADEEDPQAAAPMRLLDMASQVVAVLVLLVVSIGLFLMTRRRKTPVAPTVEWQPAVDLPIEAGDDEPDERSEHELVTAGVGGDSRRMSVQEAAAAIEANNPIKRDVTELVERQPEEIANLLRSWLADRRS